MEKELNYCKVPEDKPIYCKACNEKVLYRAVIVGEGVATVFDHRVFEIMGYTNLHKNRLCTEQNIIQVKLDEPRAFILRDER